MEKVMNKREILEITVNNLQAIMVPVVLKKEIAEPIERNIMNLVAVMQMIDKEEEMKEAEKDGNTDSE